MARVLHLVPKFADYQTETSAAKLIELPGSIARFIGRGGDYSSFARAVVALRRQPVEVDLVHAWGMQALLIAAAAAKRPIVFSPTTFPSRRETGWLRSVMARRQVQVVCHTETMYRALVGRGIASSRCRVIRPGVDVARIPSRDDPAMRSALRVELGFEDDEQVLMAVGESTRAADHPRAAFGAVVLHVLDPQYRLLLWGRGPSAEKTRRFINRLAQPKLCVIANQKLKRAVAFDELLPAADVAVFAATGPVETLPLAMCMAAGVPIVAAAGPATAELLEDGRNALVVPKPTPRLIARRILDLREDQTLRQKIVQQARQDSQRLFSQAQFVELFQRIYMQVARGDEGVYDHVATNVSVTVRNAASGG